jgi:hypothetical protein
LALERVFFEGSAELIAAPFISTLGAALVRDATTRPMKMDFGSPSYQGVRVADQDNPEYRD